MFVRDEPIEILGASPDDAPICFLPINSDWAVLLIGLSEYMLSPRFWDAATGDVDAAIADAARLIQILGGCMVDNVAIFAEQRPHGTHGGTSVANGHQYRDINTVVAAQPWASLSGGQIQMQPGRYHVHARAAACGVFWTRLTLHNSEAPITYWRGDSAFAQHPSGSPTSAWATIDTVIELTSLNNVLVRQYTYMAVSDYGLGVYSVESGIEQYVTVIITKLSA